MAETSETLSVDEAFELTGMVAAFGPDIFTAAEEPVYAPNGVSSTGLVPFQKSPRIIQIKGCGVRSGSRRWNHVMSCCQESEFGCGIKGFTPSVLSMMARITSFIRLEITESTSSGRIIWTPMGSHTCSVCSHLQPQTIR